MSRRRKSLKGLSVPVCVVLKREMYQLVQKRRREWKCSRSAVLDRMIAEHETTTTKVSALPAWWFC